MNIGLLGVGEHMCRSHLPYFQIPVVAYYDPVNSIEHKAVKVDTEDDVINHPNVHIIFISSPDVFHPEQLLKSVQAGKHVFVEKPLAIDEEGLIKVKLALRIANEKGLIVQSCHPRRFDPPILWLKDNLHEVNKTLTKFVFRFHYHRVNDSWKKKRSLMLDHLGHEMDLVSFLFDHPLTLDELSVKSDSHAFYRVDGYIRDRNLFIEFIGERLLEESMYYETIELHYDNPLPSIKVIHLNNGLCIHCDSHEEQIPLKDYNTMFQAVNSNFFNSISQNIQPYLSVFDLIRNNEVPIHLQSKK